MRGASSLSSSMEALGDEGGASSFFSALFSVLPLCSPASSTESRFFRPPSPRACRIRRARMPSSAPFMASEKAFEEKLDCLFFWGGEGVEVCFPFCFLLSRPCNFSCFLFLEETR